MVEDIKSSKMERSTVEAYIGITVAIITVVFPMTWWMRCALLTILASIVIDVAFRHHFIIARSRITRGIIAFALVAIIAALAWHPIHEEYKKEKAISTSRPAVPPIPVLAPIEKPPSSVDGMHPEKSADIKNNHKKAKDKVEISPTLSQQGQGNIAQIGNGNQINIQPPADATKGKALNLADEIIEFGRRRKGEYQTLGPSGSKGETGEQMQARLNSFSQNTPFIFNSLFGLRLRESISELKDKKVFVDRVQQSCNRPMMITIEMCGNDLRKAAQELTSFSFPNDVLPVKRISFTQEPTNSSRPDAPYAVKVVIQTNVKIQPVLFSLRCDADIIEGKVGMIGNSVFFNSGNEYGRHIFGFHFSNDFLPETPITVTLMSASPIKVLTITE